MGVRGDGETAAAGLDQEPEIAVVLVEDHAAVRRGLELLLRKGGCRIAGSGGSASAGASLVHSRRPDVALIDIGLPDGSGARLARELLDADPALGVILYTGIEDEQLLEAGLDCGASGFALKAGDPDELLHAVRVVARGGSYVDPRLRPLLLNRARKQRVLSDREREVLGLLAEGLTGEAIAGRLHIAPETVRTHIRNVMRKLGAHTRAQAVAVALGQGEITPERRMPARS